MPPVALSGIRSHQGCALNLAGQKGAPSPPRVSSVEVYRAPIPPSNSAGTTAERHLRGIVGDKESSPHPLASWIQNKTQALAPFGQRHPDISSVSISLPVGGPIVSIGVKVSIDQLHRLYVEPQVSMGLSISPPISASVAWLGKSRKPGADTLHRNLSGFSAGANAGIVANASYSVGSGTPVVGIATEVGASVSAGFGFPISSPGKKEPR